MPPQTIQYASYDNQSTTGGIGILALCTIETSYIEVSVFCEALNCNVNQMRQSLLPHQPNTYTGLDSCDSFGTAPASE
jgi:hypothetical protein